MLSRSNLRPFDKNNFFTFSSIEKLSKRVLASHALSLTITLLNFSRILLSFLANTMSAEVVSRLQLDADLCLVMFSTTPMTSSDESFAMVGTPWIHKLIKPYCSRFSMPCSSWRSSDLERQFVSVDCPQSLISWARSKILQICKKRLAKN